LPLPFGRGYCHIPEVPAGIQLAPLRLQSGHHPGSSGAKKRVERAENLWVCTIHQTFAYYGPKPSIFNADHIEQSRIQIEELRESATTFVSTNAYQKALLAVDRLRFVLLLGPPGTGKSSVAANICLSGLAEGKYTESLILETPSLFQSHWDPYEPKRLYWFDDVFGATSLDMAQIFGWQRALPKLHTAIKHGASVIFTSRDYIYREAVRHLKTENFPLLEESQVIVNVTDLAEAERGQILYNHIKFGNLSQQCKSQIKPFLSTLVSDPSFSPEAARRLGDMVFFDRIRVDNDGLRDFIRHMGNYFEKLVGTLDHAHQAALVLVALHNNRLASPIQEGALPQAFKAAYGVGVPEIKLAIEEMRGSLITLTTIRGRAEWSLHHPSMLEALQSLLSGSPEKIELFLLASSAEALFRDTSTLDNRDHRVFVPQPAWPILVNRLQRSLFDSDWQDWRTPYATVGYLFRDGSAEFLGYLWNHHPDILERAVTPAFHNLNSGFWFGLARRMRELDLWSNEIEFKAVKYIEESVTRTGDMHFLDNDDVADLLGMSRRDELVKTVLEDRGKVLRNVVDGWDDIDQYGLDDFNESLEVLEDYLKRAGRLTDATKDLLNDLHDDANLRYSEHTSDHVEDDAEPEYRGDAFPVSSISGIFSDVDA
jgi:hypothetical protein